MLLQCGDIQLDLSKPQIMGILNTTPDSFSDGGSYHHQGDLDLSLVIDKAADMVAQGASIIDVGGESTRPGANSVALSEELERVVPVVEAIKQRLSVVVSVDTSNAEVIRQSAAVGAGMINDVRALQREGALAAAAATGLPVCLMHMQGQPKTMQLNTDYNDVVAEVMSFLQQRTAAAISVGIDAKQILIDPGFGFGKSLDHNVVMMQRLAEFKQTGQPLMVGVSRKSMIDGLLARPVDQRLAGSIGLGLQALQRGANILRVHDVAQSRDMVELYWAIDAQKS